MVKIFKFSFLSAYVFRLMRIDERISAWNHIEICILYVYPNIQKKRIYMLFMRSIYIWSEYTMRIGKICAHMRSYKRISAWIGKEIMRILNIKAKSAWPAIVLIPLWNMNAWISKFRWYRNIESRTGWESAKLPQI